MPKYDITAVAELSMVSVPEQFTVTVPVPMFLNCILLPVFMDANGKVSVIVPDANIMPLTEFMTVLTEIFLTAMDVLPDIMPPT